MATVDVRTRRESDALPLDFVAFHEEVLPQKIAAGSGELAARGLALLDLPPMAFEVDGRSYTYAPGPCGIEVLPGDDRAAAVAALTPAIFSDLVQDLRSTVALVIGNDVEMRRGGQRTLLEWEPVLRALVDGRPVYEPGSIDFRDRDGAPLDLKRSFAPEDARDEMAHFLAEAGFLHIAGVFEADEMQRIERDIERAVPRYAPDDGRSWWARTSAGEHRVVRLQHFHEHSETTATLLRDPRYRRIGEITDDGHEHGQRIEGNCVEALVKPIGVLEGISDVSWHKDCGLGRHSYRCSSITVGISVTPSDRHSGQLCVVAGSHRASVPPKGLRDDLDLPRIGLPTHAGDVTVHLSCTLHMSVPPVRSERRVLYAGFDLPPRPGDAGAGAEVIRRIREQAPQSVGRKGTIGDDPALARMNAFDTRGLR